MKTIKILVLSLSMLLTACVADVFPQPSDDAGPTVDAATADGAADTIPDPDGGAEASPEASPTKDATPDAPTADSAVDATDADVDAGNEPMCAPLGYKTCPAQFNKCKVTANDGTATCVVPGGTPHQSGCTKDDDCGNNEVCDVSLCRSLCEKTYQTPWGTDNGIWGAHNCATACPNGTNYQLPRLPSWLGVCMY